MHRLTGIGTDAGLATNISHDSNSPRAFGVFAGRNLPVFSAR